jgi:hypothetical protein
LEVVQYISISEIEGGLLSYQILKTITMQRSEGVNGITKMPRFTDSITITVDVDTIFEKLLGQLPEDLKSREILAHAVVGSAVENGTISYIYNALNGYTNEINFEVGNMVVCTETERHERYDANLEDEDGKRRPNVEFTPTEDYKPNWKRRSVQVGECKVLEINLYKKDKLKVQFQSAAYSGDKMETKEVWVSHKACTRVPMEADLYKGREVVSSNH